MITENEAGKTVSASDKTNDKTNGKNRLADHASEGKSKPPVSAAKLRNLKKQLKELEEENAGLNDQLLRKAAEFENYKKRRENEYLQLIGNANAQLIAELLPILDDLERSIKSGQESTEDGGFYEGVELIHKNLVKVLEGHNVKPIEAVGQEFDPEQHEALMQVESSNHPPGTVVEEHLKGYFISDRVLRYSQVSVSK